MYMICHQAIALYFQGESVGLLLKKLKIYTAVVINKEYILMVITTLGDMVWCT